MLYVEPDLNFLNFIKDNNYTIVLSISDTNNTYDLKEVVGVVNKSSNVPNCRPNFFDKTNLYVITLYTQWNGYPPLDSLGKINIIGMNDNSNKNESTKLAQIIGGDSSTNDLNQKNPYIGFILLIVAFLCLCFMIFMFSRTYRK